MTASSAELATLSRNVYQLNALLRQANVESARAYRKMLDTMTRDVRRHLELAARVLTDLQPRGQGAGDRSSGLQLTKGITPCPKHRTSTAF